MSTLTIEDALKLQVGADIRLADIDPASTPGLKGSGDKLDKRLDKSQDDIKDELEDLQERLFANHRAGTNPGSVLIVLQGMDTSGKGGAVKALYRALDPQGIRLASFGKPTEAEQQHDFLWRVRKQLPEPGMIGIFDRSHYEDVLIQRVEEIATPEVIEQRYTDIAEFEKELAQQGTRVLKFMLHISPEFQKENLIERLEKSEKHWKYDPSDIEARLKWEDYQRAYEIAIQRTATDESPWFVVPSDNKDYARLVVQLVLLDTLQKMNLDWPSAPVDAETELERVKALPDDPRD
ncbi:PPK2 family polyphosphate kinase [Corynebacterium dentalis]|uniref:PPK2 family polyphosphate kinase n=1 Tax=Corynebacterium dentalis TaxID=2014528 RepID=UPI00370DBEB9